MKKTVVCDIECYRNYFLVMFRNVETGVMRYFEMFDGQDLDRATIRQILLSYRIITFNGMHYDIPMLMLAMKPRATCAVLKRASDTVIATKPPMRDWQFEREFDVKVWDKIDHIDLKELAPGVMISLKQYAARMHSKRLQDLPIDPDETITVEQRGLLRDYCGNSDCVATIDLWNKVTKGKDDILAIREMTGAAIGLDLRSKSDAQMAEAVIKKEVEKLKGERIFKPEIPAGTRYRYTPPAFLRFRTQQLRDVLAAVADSNFIVKADGKIQEPPALQGRKVKIGGSTYAMGIGGLHSTEKKAAHVADDDTLLIDRDVASFYPFLIKMCGLAPRNMGALFLKVYSAWIDKRIAAKHRGDKTTAQTLKIFLNGIFGKLGNRHSIVYAPDLLIQVTLTGQLVLLMLIEWVESIGIPVVSANTDGIVIKCPKARKAELDAIVAHWEKATGLTTEETRYKALYSRDINNYIALKEGGGHKTKGVFSEPGLQKNVENEIVNDAATAFLEHDTPVAETIIRCRDVRKFLCMRKVDGGGNYGGAYLGKTVRWYTGRDKTCDIRRVRPNKLGNFDKVAGSAGAIPMMELQDEIPADLDYAAYIREANDVLRSVGAI